VEKAGWVVQDTRAANIHAAQGVAIREFALAPGHGHAVNMPRGFRPHCRHSADRLRQAILKKAFSGQLLSSAPDYEFDTNLELPMAAGITNYL